MKIKTTDLTGPALRYAVAVCEGLNVGIFTVEEQWERFIKGASPEDLNKHAESYAAVKAGFKTEICRVHSDGYKSTLDARTWRFDEDWSVGGPLIEREWIELGAYHDQWRAVFHGEGGSIYQDGPTPLIAAMRCYVAATLGDEVDVPEGLL